MPSTAAPTAPMPVQAAYAVPTGSTRMASARNQKLNDAATRTTSEGHSRVKPSEYFMPITQTISRIPATTSTSHATAGLVTYVMAFPFREGRVVIGQPFYADGGASRSCRWNHATSCQRPNFQPTLR